MSLKSKITVLLTISLLLLSTFAVITRNQVLKAQGSEAEFTGNFADGGSDEDGNGKYDYLDVSVEINVSVAGVYRISAYRLRDESSMDLYLSADCEKYLEPGISSLIISFYGPAICGAHFVPKSIPEIDLYLREDYYCSYLDTKWNTALLNSYNYADFDCVATLKETIYDVGVDSDSDGLFDFLQVDVGIEVFEETTFIVSINHLSGVGSFMPFYNESTSFFAVGNYTLTLTVYGPTIFSNLHSSEGNFSMIEYIYLCAEDNGQFYEVERRENVPLSRTYVYSEFESHAFLTGTIFDNGKDEDGDGLFDCLTLGIEVNVTEAGRYLLLIQGLKGVKNGSLQEIYYDMHLDEHFNKQIYIINFTVPGEMIAYEHFDPTNITGLNLREPEYDIFLSAIPTADLSRRYNYTEFNSPLNDMDLTFTVYPNATVRAEGKINYTRIYPASSQPLFNTTLNILTAGNVTTAHANGTMTIPRNIAYTWPFNSTVANFIAQYSNEILSAQLNASVTMPPEASTAFPINSTAGDLTLTATYANGVIGVNLDCAGQLSPELMTQLPFNVSDLTLIVEYLNGKICGNITFHAVSGLPMNDAFADITANETEIFLSGNVNVTYGNFFGMDINETTVTQYIDMISNFTGQGDSSIYNLTRGAVEFVSFNTVRTPDVGEERVDFNATFDGNFTYALAQLVTQMMSGSGANEQTIYAALDSAFSSVQNATLIMNYYSASKIGQIDLSLYSNVTELWANAIQLVPSTLPVEQQSQAEALLKIANATAYAINNAQLEAVYSGDQQKLDLTFALAANITLLKNSTATIIPDAAPPEMHDMFESLLNETYCKLNSMTASANYSGGTADFDVNCVFEGDFEKQINHEKSFYITMLDMYNPESPSSVTQFFNNTEIDINSFSLNVKQGSDWTTLTFEGLKMYPQEDELCPIRFKLQQWLNSTEDPTASPREFEKLKITFAGGFNGTHVVLLSPVGTVPSPDISGLDYETMAWQNTTISSLKEFLFQIAYQEVVNYVGTDYYVPVFTNSTLSNFSFNPDAKRISFNVTGTTGTGFFNITIPRALLDAQLADWIVRIDGVELTMGDYSITNNDGYVFIYLEYSHSSHLIEISGTWVISEFQPDLLPLMLIMLILATAAIGIKKRRRLNALRAKYQSAVHTFVSRFQSKN
jgi:hypothetical protein